VYAREGIRVAKEDKQVKCHQCSCFKVYDVTVCLIYRSPSAPPEAVTELVGLVRGGEKNTVFIGNFNLPGINWDTGEAPARYREFVEAVEEAGMVQMVDFATQIKGNCLVLVITNMPERVTEVAEVGRLGNSDHEMIFVKIETGRYEEANKRVRNWGRADWEGMRKEMRLTDWNGELADMTANDMWEKLKRKVKAAIDRHVPWREVKCRGRPV
jgi:ABC-type transporter Mla MlaB component